MRFDGTHGAGDMIEDQKSFVATEDRVVVRQGVVVAHMVEGFQVGDAGFQDALAHL